MGRVMDRSQPSRRIDEPQPGFFRMRIIKGGPYVGAIIKYRLGMLVAEVNGAASDLDHVWTSGERISPADWEFLDRNRPLDPHIPINHRTNKPAF